MKGREPDIIGRVRTHLDRRDWSGADRRALTGALRDIDVLERRAVGRAELSGHVLELRETLNRIRRDRDGGLRRAASLL